MTTKARDKKNQLIEATIDLFAKEGFWNTSTARISKHAGVATGTLFNYFPSKEALIDAVYLHLKLEMKAFITPGYPADEGTGACIAHVWRRYAEWGVHSPVHYQLLEQLRLSNLVSQQIEDRLMEEIGFMHELIETARQQGLFGEVSLEFAGALIHATVTATINVALAHQLTGPALQKHIAQGLSVLWTGIQPSK
ncbi:TetR/AcrR family transcriptional regulator [Kiritimatiellaeota bacterium B1221]|nr:TetR/AcrR family transcriptional regulator [Kiritimatiellaeota bacterium B1221]